MAVEVDEAVEAGAEVPPVGEVGVEVPPVGVAIPDAGKPPSMRP